MVPVLPAAGRPPESAAALPVPYLMTFCSSEVTSTASSSGKAWTGSGVLSSIDLPFSFVTFTITRGSLPKRLPSIRLPPFANAENARAISSGLPPWAPNPIEK